MFGQPLATFRFPCWKPGARNSRSGAVGGGGGGGGGVVVVDSQTRMVKPESAQWPTKRDDLKAHNGLDIQSSSSAGTESLFLGLHHGCLADPSEHKACGHVRGCVGVGYYC